MVTSLERWTIMIAPVVPARNAPAAVRKSPLLKLTMLWPLIPLAPFFSAGFADSVPCEKLLLFPDLSVQAATRSPSLPLMSSARNHNAGELPPNGLAGVHALR